MGAICGKVETQGESRKEVEEDLRIDNRKRNSLIFAVIEWVSAVDGDNRVKDQEKLATIIVRDSASFSVIFRTSTLGRRRLHDHQRVYRHRRGDREIQKVPRTTLARRARRRSRKRLREGISELSEASSSRNGG